MTEAVNLILESDTAAYFAPTEISEYSIKCLLQ